MALLQTKLVLIMDGDEHEGDVLHDVHIRIGRAKRGRGGLAVACWSSK